MNVICFKCGDDGNVVRVDVNDPDQFTCDCGETYTTDDVREHIGEWQRVIGWLATHPSRTPHCAAVAG